MLSSACVDEKFPSHIHIYKTCKLGQTNFDEKLFVKMQNMATELIPDGV
jgi:hypothetical protein